MRPLDICSSLTKVFWKGEFEGKNLFFKKGFPLLIKLEKTSLKGRQLAGDRKFFQVSETQIPLVACGGSIPKSSERGMPLRPAGSRASSPAAFHNRLYRTTIPFQPAF